MKIAVLAASGRSGQTFVATALEAGHEIRAGVRNKHHLRPHVNLEIVQCNATDETQLRNLIAGQEAVASFIGHVRGSEPNVQTIAIKKLIAVMKESHILRLVSLTGTGVRFPNDTINIVDRFLNLSIRIIDPARVKDGKNYVKVLKHSDLEWTVIRVLKLQNASPKSFRLREHGPTKPYVGRQEVAQAVLQVLTQHSFIQQAPIISKP